MKIDLVGKFLRDVARQKIPQINRIAALSGLNAGQAEFNNRIFKRGENCYSFHLFNIDKAKIVLTGVNRKNYFTKLSTLLFNLWIIFQVAIRYQFFLHRVL